MSTFPPQPPPPHQQKTSGLAIGALVGTFLCFPIGVILGIVALVQLSRDPSRKGKGLAIAAIVIGGALMLFVPVMAAIAIPNFMRFQARSKQAECKANLRSAWTAQRLLLDGEERYSERPAELGLSFDGTRYAYFFGPEATFDGDAASAVRPTRPENLDADMAFRRIRAAGIATGIEGECPEDCAVTIACAGNLDGDETLDVWSVSSDDRQLGGEFIPAGVPHNHVSDITD